MKTCEQCGGRLVGGHMYGDKFVAGTVDLSYAFAGHEHLLDSWFPDGIPAKGPAAVACSKCFETILQE